MAYRQNPLLFILRSKNKIVPFESVHKSIYTLKNKIEHCNLTLTVLPDIGNNLRKLIFIICNKLYSCVNKFKLIYGGTLVRKCVTRTTKKVYWEESKEIS